MKRISKVLAVMVLAALSLFVSCNNEPAMPDGTATVKFVGSADGGNSRSLTKTNPVFEPGKYIWKYEAVKKDSSGLSTGATDGKTPVGTDGSINNSVGPFSLGDWEFRLYAYTTKDHADNDEYAYAGTVNAKITSGTTNTIGVTVKAFSTGADGYIQFPAAGEITLQDEKGHSISAGEYEEKITITDAYTDKPLDGLVMTDRTYTVPSGFYEVTVQYHKTGDATLVYGESTIFVNVWDYLTTKIGGSLDEIQNDVTFDPGDSADLPDSDGTEEATVQSGTGLSMSVETSPVANVAGSTSTTTSVEIPADALSGYEGKKAVLTVSSYAMENSEGFQIAEGESFMGGIDLSLTIGGESVTSFTKPVTVTTYVAKGLSNVAVKYNGTGEQPAFKSYDPISGELVFTTTHFSEFYVTSDSVAYIPETNTAYQNLGDAFENATDGNTIILVNDVVLDERIDIDKKIVFDLAGFEITEGDTIELSGCLFYVSGGNLVVNDSSSDKRGRIDFTTERLSSSGYSAVYGVFQVTPYENISAELTINGGTFIGEYYAITGNGTAHNTKITINDGYFEARNGTGVYHPQIGELYVNGGTIKGYEAGIEVRSGKVVVDGGVIEAESMPTTVGPNGNGTTSSGAAIAIAQHTTKNSIEVIIKDGYFKGYASVYESNPQENDPVDTSKVKLEIQGGFF